jgi:hypothetical protein
MKNNRQLRPIWRYIFDAIQTAGALFLVYIFTVLIIVIGG